MLTIFKAMLLTSLIGSVFFLTLAALNPITRKYFSSAWHYGMCIAVLFVMMCPIVITFPERTVESGTAVLNTVSEEIILQEEVHNEIKIPSVNFNFIAVIWFSAAVLLVVEKLIKYAILLWEIRKYSVLTDSFDKRITVRKNSTFSSPVLIGIFKPVLLLPESEISEVQMKNIIMHEMMHFKRKDVLIKWFSVIAKCVHWFNPIVYFVCRKLEEESEISCDESVTKNMERSERKSYFETILMLIASGNKKETVFSAGMTKMSNIKIMKRRFEMIKNSKKTNKKVHIFSIMLAFTVVLSVFFVSGTAAGELLEKTGITNTDKDNAAVKITLNTPIYDTENEKCEFMLPNNGTVTNGFGTRVHPFLKTEIRHNGIDIGAYEGDNVAASEKGVVAETGFDSESGNYIIVSHSAAFTAKYAGLSEILVNKGDEVSKGQIIGKVGKTGRSTGPHLHFELCKNGAAVNPLEYIK